MKRRWFQFHLSSAVASMLIASVFLGLNTIPLRHEIWFENRGAQSHSYYGWPWEIRCRHIETGNREEWGTNWLGTRKDRFGYPDIVIAAKNIATSASISLIIGALIETLIRRREARKP